MSLNKLDKKRLIFYYLYLYVFIETTSVTEVSIGPLIKLYKT